MTLLCSLPSPTMLLNPEGTIEYQIFSRYGKASQMRYLYGAFVLCTLALVWAVVGIVRHIRRHNAEMSAHMEAPEIAPNPPKE